jgi:hypothetical protein
MHRTMTPDESWLLNRAWMWTNSMGEESRQKGDHVAPTARGAREFELAQLQAMANGTLPRLRDYQLYR